MAALTKPGPFISIVLAATAIHCRGHGIGGRTLSSKPQRYGVLTEFQPVGGMSASAEWLSSFDKPAGKLRGLRPSILAAMPSGPNEQNRTVMTLASYDSKPSADHLSREGSDFIMPPVIFKVVPDWGWWHRGEIPANSTFGWAACRYEEPWMLEQWLKLMNGVLAYFYDFEPGSLLLGAGISLGNNSEVDVREGDLIFVNGYVNVDAYQKHSADPVHKAIIELFKVHQLEYKCQIWQPIKYRTRAPSLWA